MTTTQHSPDALVSLGVPAVHGGTPTAYGVPLAQTEEDLRQADAAFMGVLWGAPITPEFVYTGYGANYGTTGASPGQFRFTSLRHRGGYLPELDLAVLDAVKLVDHGDVAAGDDMSDLLARVEAKVRAMRRSGCAAITYGGNAGPSSYAIVRAIAQESPGPVTVINFDAHSDNSPGDWETEDPRNSRWASTWVHQMLELPEIDATRYRHVGLRGPANDRGVFDRFRDQGVERDQIISYGELKRARRSGFDDWVQRWAEEATSEAHAVWVAIDIDVLDLGSNPHYADEPLGPNADEVIDMVAGIARACGRERFAGLSFMAIPPEAVSLHLVASYIVLHALAGLQPAA